MRYSWHRSPAESFNGDLSDADYYGPATNSRPNDTGYTRQKDASGRQAALTPHYYGDQNGPYMMPVQQQQSGLFSGTYAGNGNGGYSGSGAYPAGGHIGGSNGGASNGAGANSGWHNYGRY